MLENKWTILQLPANFKHGSQRAWLETLPLELKSLSIRYLSGTLVSLRELLGKVMLARCWLFLAVAVSWPTFLPSSLVEFLASFDSGDAEGAFDFFWSIFSTLAVFLGSEKLTMFASITAPDLAT